MNGPEWRTKLSLQMCEYQASELGYPGDLSSRNATQTKKSGIEERERGERMLLRGAVTMSSRRHMASMLMLRNLDAKRRDSVVMTWTCSKSICAHLNTVQKVCVRYAVRQTRNGDATFVTR